jgi:hypothetical protein
LYLKEINQDILRFLIKQNRWKEGILVLLYIRHVEPSVNPTKVIDLDLTIAINN